MEPTPADEAHVAPPDEAAAFARARQLHATGDAAGAMELLPALVAAHPSALSVRLLAARCAAQMGVSSVARAAAEAAVACDPGSWEAHVLVARALTDVDPEAAVAAAAQAVSLAPGEPEATAAHARAIAARTAASTTAERPTAGIGARLGVTRPSRPEPATPLAPAPPLTATAPPELVAPTVRVPPAERPIRLPAALRDGADPALLAPPGPPHDGEEPAAATGSEAVPGWRAMIRVLGLALWVYLGFRYGVQVIGGPVGIMVFLATLAGAAYATRWIRAT